MNIKIEQNKVDNKIYNYLTTDYIYLNIPENSNILVKDNDYVYMNDLVIDSGIKKVFSSVSGNVLGLSKINNSNYLVIENDLKNKRRKIMGSKKYINRYTREELFDLLNKYGITCLSETSKILIISGIEDIYEDNYNLLTKEYIISILECIDALIEIMNIKKCVLAIDSSKNELVEELVNNIGTYPKINLKLFNYYYPLHKKEVLINKLVVKNSKYNYSYLTIKDILNIYNVLKTKQPIVDNYVTLCGNLLDYKRVYRIKNGTNLSDFINEIDIKNTGNIIINGLLNGTIIKDLNFIIDSNVKSIVVNKIYKYVESDCINCGICTSNCPININPKYMYFNKDKKSRLYKEQCIKCGLCSYLCPSKINLNKGVKDEEFN